MAEESSFERVNIHATPLPSQINVQYERNSGKAPVADFIQEENGPEIRTTKPHLAYDDQLILAQPPQEQLFLSEKGLEHIDNITGMTEESSFELAIHSTQAAHEQMQKELFSPSPFSSSQLTHAALDHIEKKGSIEKESSFEKTELSGPALEISRPVSGTVSPEFSEISEVSCYPQVYDLTTPFFDDEASLSPSAAGKPSFSPEEAISSMKSRQMSLTTISYTNQMLKSSKQWSSVSDTSTAEIHHKEQLLEMRTQKSNVKVLFTDQKLRASFNHSFNDEFVIDESEHFKTTIHHGKQCNAYEECEQKKLKEEKDLLVDVDFLNKLNFYAQRVSEEIAENAANDIAEVYRRRMNPRARYFDDQYGSLCEEDQASTTSSNE
uniref:Uncharacterized protein n=1 Tax=Ditylenchus dipsaci TaxID=166011 RepID=A0A915CSC7_9BILA